MEFLFCLADGKKFVVCNSKLFDILFSKKFLCGFKHQLVCQGMVIATPVAKIMLRGTCGLYGVEATT